jgi:hypothetical protein
MNFALNLQMIVIKKFIFEKGIKGMSDITKRIFKSADDLF